MKSPDHLRQAFIGVYHDLAQHGLCEWDDDIVELLWSDFLADMRAGFPSLFTDNGRHAASSRALPAAH
jgi:hypothetical protein